MKIIKIGLLSTIILIFSQTSAFSSQGFFSKEEEKHNSGFKLHKESQPVKEESISEHGFFDQPNDGPPPIEPPEPGVVPVTDGLYVLIFLSLLYVCYAKVGSKYKNKKGSA